MVRLVEVATLGRLQEIGLLSHVCSFLASRKVDLQECRGSFHYQRLPELEGCNAHLPRSREIKIPCRSSRADGAVASDHA